MKITLKTGLSIETLARIDELFRNRNWLIEDKDDNENSLFRRFCSLFRILDEEEQELLFKLTEDYFRRISLGDYPEYIKIALENMQKQMKKKFEDINKIYVLPLLRPSDQGNIKSSTLVAYLFQSPDLAYQSFLQNKSINVINKLEKKYISKINNNPQAVLLVVDDFIGTGGTANDCLKDIIETHEIKTEKIVVLSLIAQKNGISTIRNKNIKVFTAETINRGISDNFSDENIQEAKTIMERIESKIKPRKEHSFGYLESEALISLIRTPNNTFPIYWYQKAKFKHKVPFPRKEG